MRTIGVRELKAHLSRVLREIQLSGEVVLVTDRGRVVAELRLPTPSPAEETPADRGLRRLAAEGGLRVAERRQEPHRKSPLTHAAGTAQALLAAEREEP